MLLYNFRNQNAAKCFIIVFILWGWAISENRSQCIIYIYIYILYKIPINKQLNSKKRKVLCRVLVKYILRGIEFSIEIFSIKKYNNKNFHVIR